MNWYAVQTQPNRENVAVANLERQGFDVWMPLCERIIRHARQARRVRRPLFPGYLFINLDISEIIASKAYKEKERSYSKIFIKNLLIKYVFLI